MPAEKATEDRFLGLELRHYRIIEKVGAGGMGVVYRARDKHLDREVAIKVLRPGTLADESSRRRFRNEALALSKLNHPNIATVHDFDTQEGCDYLVMEYIHGVTLSEKLSQRSLPEREVLALGTQLAEGLSAAHEHGVIHRDLKPGNLRLTTDGRLKILDFGLAKLRQPLLEEGETATTLCTEAFSGTLPYMAPEQLTGEDIDARTDIHAVGLVLYEMATGQRPFAKLNSGKLFGAILHDPPVSPCKLNPKVSSEFERIVGKCLEKDPKNRYQSAKELAIDLRRLQTGVPSAVQTIAMPTKWSSAKSVGLGLSILASVIVLLIAFDIGGWRERMLGRAGASRIESLAVLPLANLSGDPQQEYFADGMTDELITNLGKVGALRVISRTSVMQYKQTKKTLPTIAQELNVDAVVEGSVLRSGNRVRITAKLMQAKAERHLWGESYDRDMSDILSLQSEVARAIASEIKTKVTPHEEERLARARQVNPEVYEATLRGKATIEYATRQEQIHQAIELFQKATDRDPTYAPAWAGLGEALWCLAGTGFEFVAPAEVRDRAIAAAEKALALDEHLAEAHTARAVIAFDGEWDLVNAQQHFDTALKLQPGYAAAHTQYALILTTLLRRFEEARRHLDRARELDPLSPYNDINLVVWWQSQGRPEKALEEGELARQRNPTLWAIPWLMGYTRLQLEQPSQAASEFEGALKLLRPERPVAVLAPLGLGYGLAGPQDEALRILTEMEEMSQKRYVSPYSLAVVYSGLGRMDEAFRLLNRALDQRSPDLVFCTSDDQEAVAFRRDPRWKPFIDRLRGLVRLPPGTPDPYT